MDIGKMLLHIAQTSGGRNTGGQIGGTIGGLIGSIFGPIGSMAGGDLGNAIGNRTQLLTEGKDPLEQLLGIFAIDPILKPLERILPFDLLMGGGKSKKKSNPNEIVFGGK
jgi:hypothetical protein